MAESSERLPRLAPSVREPLSAELTAPFLTRPVSTAMHAVQLADLAAILALHGPALLYRRELIAEEAIHAYWAASRARFDSWHRRLGEHRELEREGETLRMRQWWDEQYPLLEEILLSEPLTRLYAALGASLDSNRQDAELSPITHSVFVTHLEARNRVLQLMTYGRGATVEVAVRLNHLRIAVERCCDALIGQLGAPAESEWEKYAVEAPRARAFAEDARQIPSGTARSTAGWLMTAAMRETLLRRCQSQAATPVHNQAVSDAVLMSLRPDLFDSVGVLKSLWLHRLQRGAEQADRVLHELAASDLNAGSTLSGYETVRDIAFGRWLA